MPACICCCLCLHLPICSRKSVPCCRFALCYMNLFMCFVLPSFLSSKSHKGPHWRWIQQQWKRCQAWFAGQAVARSPSQWVRLDISIDLIRSTPWHGNGLISMRIWLNRFGAHNREYSDASVHRTLEMIPCEASKGPSIGFTFDE